MSNLSKRIISALVLIPFVLLLVFFSSNLVFSVSISLVSFFACFEFFSMYRVHSIKKISIFFSTLSGLLTFLISFHSLYSDLLVFYLAFSIISSFLYFMFISLSSDILIRSLFFSFFGIFYTGVLMGFIGSTFNVSSSFSHGRYFVFLLLLCTFSGDTFAYSFGRLFGKHKLFPRISPNKTWEGAFGNLLASLFSVFVVRYFYLSFLSILHSIFLSFLLSLFCQLGDLSESFLKRGMGVKDSSNIIPGHGGILDRIDALLFGAPIVYFFAILY